MPSSLEVRSSTACIVLVSTAGGTYGDGAAEGGSAGTAGTGAVAGRSLGGWPDGARWVLQPMLPALLLLVVGPLAAAAGAGASACAGIACAYGAAAGRLAMGDAYGDG